MAHGVSDPSPPALCLLFLLRYRAREASPWGPWPVRLITWVRSGVHLAHQKPMLAVLGRSKARFSSIFSCSNFACIFASTFSPHFDCFFINVRSIFAQCSVLLASLFRPSILHRFFFDFASLLGRAGPRKVLFFQ